MGYKISLKIKQNSTISEVPSFKISYEGVQGEVTVSGLTKTATEVELDFLNGIEKEDFQISKLRVTNPESANGRTIYHLQLGSSNSNITYDPESV